ncbi:MAG: hypothetical protein LBI13_07560 [Streptococcaceae bacterium]|jgi:hypothetical protein|nr:hypothetical protein [Streptococcaceae bacterium]
MGMIYDSGDSANLISALQTNLAVCTQVTGQLKSGVATLQSALQSGELQGAVYTAGNGLFSQVILPAIQKTDAAVANVQGELNSYMRADGSVSQYGTLDEDKLNTLIKEKQSQVDTTARFISQISSNPTLGSDSRPFQTSLSSYQAQLQDLKNRLQALTDFNTSTQYLFKDSLTVLQSAMKGATTISGIIVSASGTYQLPQGSDLNWLTTMEDVGLYSGLLDAKALDRLDTKGMSDSDKATYEADVSKQMLWLQEQGMPDEGVLRYVDYLNKEYSNYTSFGPSVSIFIPTDWLLPSQNTYANGGGKLLIQGIYNLFANLKNCTISETSYKAQSFSQRIPGITGQNIWTVTLPDGESLNSAFLGYVGGYIPHLKYTHTTYTVVKSSANKNANVYTGYTDPTASTADSYSLYLNGKIDEAASDNFSNNHTELLSTTYFLNNNLGANMTSSERAAIALLKTVPGMSAMQDSADPNRQDYVTEDLLKDTVTQVVPLVAGELSSVLKLGSVAEAADTGEALEGAGKAMEEIPKGSEKTLNAFLEDNPKANIGDYNTLVKDQSPWPKDFVPKASELKSNDTFEMALSKGQPVNRPGNFATNSNTIENVDYVRNNLAVRSDWKPNIDRVVQYKVKEGMTLPVKEGPVGPQIDLTTNTYLKGGANQYQIAVDNKDIMKYLDVVSVRNIK